MPTLDDEFVPTSTNGSTTIICPIGGMQNPVGPTFTAAGSCAMGVTVLKVRVLDGITEVFRKDDVQVPYPRYWACTVTVTPPPATSKMHTLEVTPYTGSTPGTVVTKDIWVNPAMTFFVAKAEVRALAAEAGTQAAPGPESVALAPAAMASYYEVRIPHTYPPPVDAAQQLYDVVASMRQYVTTDGALHFERLSPAYMIGQTSDNRVLRIPYRGPGVYWARFVRIEAFGNIASSEPIPMPQG